MCKGVRGPRKTLKKKRFEELPQSPLGEVAGTPVRINLPDTKYRILLVVESTHARNFVMLYPAPRRLGDFTKST